MSKVSESTERNHWLATVSSMTVATRAGERGREKPAGADSVPNEVRG